MLAHSVIAARSAHPAQGMLFLHGILGSRANWRGIARRFVEARPSWSAVLVDLREHGDSLGLPPPHTLRAAAEDLAALEQALTLPIGGALGHSFGGKVVLQWLRSRQGRPTEAWLIDSSPAPRTGDWDQSATAELIRILETLPRTWPSREAFIAAVTEAGQSRGIARWLAMSLRRTDEGEQSFGPDLDVIRELIEDYARTDCWEVVEALPDGCTLDVVTGGESSLFSALDRARIEQIAARDSRVRVHVIEQAGHWVHVDAPEALLALLTSRRSPRR